MAKKPENAEFLHFWVVLTTVTIAITVVSRIEFLLFEVECLIVFGETIIPGNHEIFKPAFKHAYQNIWRVDSLKNLGNFKQFLFWLRFLKVGKI